MIRRLIASLWPVLRQLRPAPPPGAFRILLLHDVAARQETALDRLLAHIGRTSGFIDPDDVGARMARSEPDGACPVLVSFDDGFASNHARAKTVLARHGVKALFFVCPGLMDLPRGEQSAAVAARVFCGKTGDVPDLMTWDQVAELAVWGHAIGGHGMNHVRLAGLDPNRLGDEIAGARRGLSERLKRPVEWFAFPFGDIASINTAALEVIARHFRYCRSGVRGINRAGTSPMALFAEHVDLDAPLAYQRMVLEGGLDFRYAAARARLADMTRT